LSLGVFQDLLGYLLDALFTANAWGVPATTADVKKKLSVARLENELCKWYADERRAGREHSQIQRLESSMFSLYNAPACKLHGGETNGVLAFAPTLIRLHWQHLDKPELWTKVAKALNNIKRMCDLTPEEFRPVEHCQDYDW
jgi:hypothetical protein